MRLSYSAATFFVVFGVSHLTFAIDGTSAEEFRLRGFAQHQKDNAQLDKERLAAEVAHLEELQKWELEREKGVAAYRKEAKVQSPAIGGPEFRLDQQEKEEFRLSYEKSQKEHAKNKKTFNRESRKDLVSVEEELGLLSERPRYDYDKRCSLGFAGKFCGKSSASSGRSGGAGGGSSGTYFPPPPTFDDFGGDSGYIPPPNFGDGEGDSGFPPPPPPPPVFDGMGNSSDDFGGGSFGTPNPENDFGAEPPLPPSF